MSKRNIAFNKPPEPAFLRRLKEQAGYKEGPTVDTKRRELADVRPEDFEDRDEELPTVVVLKPGDLTAEQAGTYKKTIEKENEDKPADLSLPIVFKAREKPKTASDNDSDPEKPPKKKQKVSKKPPTKLSLLSFNEDDDEEEEND